MAEVAPDLRQRYLKEQQEYLDAVSAYEQTLNRVAGSMLSPIATQTNYSVQSEGYKRAATDPWMSQKHPELAAAANRLAKEEGEYRALDDPSANFGNSQCSIPGHIAGKFYEYVAAAEMLYLLATDENFRKDVVAKVGVMFERGGAISDFFAVANAGFAAESQAHIGGNQQAFEANEITINEGQEASVRLVNRLKTYFSEKWQAFKKGWEECGLANAVARAGIDGLFLAGEILIGGAAIRGVKFAYSLTKEGLHRIEIIAVDKALTVGERSWSKVALEDKYGKPEQNQVAGLLEDQNRSIPDRPAGDEPRGEQPKRPKTSDQRRTRSNDELAPNGKVPTGEKFQQWWDDLSYDELKSLTSSKKLRDKIGNEIRGEGGMHEWLKVSQQLEHKRLGFSMKEIQEWVTATKDAEGPLPVPTKKGDTRWRHLHESGRGSGPGSNTMHRALDELYVPPPESRNVLLKRMGYFANHYLDNGIESLPSGLRNSIRSAQ